jgi:hypothetical protein
VAAMTRRDPAGRLFDFLDTGKKVRDAGRPAHEVLAGLLKVEPPDSVPLLHRRFAKLAALPGLIERQLRALPGFEEELHLRWKEQVDPALRHFNLQAGWQEFTNKIEVTSIRDLQWCSEKLSTACAEPLIDEAELATLREDVASLLEETQASALQEGFRDFAVSHLTRILEAIDDYPIAGVQPVREAVQSVVGGLVFEHAKGTRVREAPLGGRIFRAVMLLAALCEMGSFGLQIEHRLRKDGDGCDREVAVQVIPAPHGEIPALPLNRLDDAVDTEPA